MNAATPPQALIVAALSACRNLPPLEELTDLDTQLRTRILALTPIVQTRADAMNRGTVDWYAHQRALDRSQDALTSPPGTSPLAAAIQVAELGRRLRDLDTYAREAP